MDKRVNGLDSLRLLAVSWVMLFHYAYRGAASDPAFTQLTVPAWHPVAQYGHLGVHLFFVISGFVIAKSTEGRSPLEFVLARFTRIYPAFVICMSLTFAVTVLFGAPEFSASLKQYVANLVIFSPALHQPFMDGAYWSIVYEIIFYGWVTVLLAGRRFDRHATPIALAWIALSIANEFFGPSTAVRRLFLTDASGFFLAGIAIYRLHQQGPSLRRWLMLAVATEVAAGQAIVTSRYNVVHYGAELSKPVIVAVAVAAVALVWGCTQLRRGVLPKGVAVAVGGMTYPLYLLHQHVGFIVFNRLGGLASPEVLVVGTAAGMMLAAVLIYACLERPAQRALRRVLHVPRPAGWWPGRRAAAVES